MAREKDDVITLSGVVVERLPNTTFRVQLENGHITLCHSSGKIKRNKISIVVGDPVVVELSVYDLSKGRIIIRGVDNRGKSSGQPASGGTDAVVGDK